MSGFDWVLIDLEHGAGVDMGAEGVMVPRIGNVTEAAAVASGLHYPPDGSRGIAKMLAGIDVLFIGPSDLSMELGIFGQFDHPLFKDAVHATVTAAQKAGKATGILLQNPDDYKKYHDIGIRLIACGADGTFVSEGAKNMANKLKAML
jgi:4-hydroxy-2-oxoheptanedioate aldolase